MFQQFLNQYFISVTFCTPVASYISNWNKINPECQIQWYWIIWLNFNGCIIVHIASWMSHFSASFEAGDQSKFEFPCEISCIIHQVLWLACISQREWTSGLNVKSRNNLDWKRLWVGSSLIHMKGWMSLFLNQLWYLSGKFFHVFFFCSLFLCLLETAITWTVPLTFKGKRITCSYGTRLGSGDLHSVLGSNRFRHDLEQVIQGQILKDPSTVGAEHFCRSVLLYLY